MLTKAKHTNTITKHITPSLQFPNLIEHHRIIDRVREKINLLIHISMTTTMA